MTGMLVPSIASIDFNIRSTSRAKGRRNNSKGKDQIIKKENNEG